MSVPDYRKLAEDWLYRNSSDDGWISLESDFVAANLVDLLMRVSEDAIRRTHDFYKGLPRTPVPPPDRAWFRPAAEPDRPQVSTRPADVTRLQEVGPMVEGSPRASERIRGDEVRISAGFAGRPGGWIGGAVRMGTNPEAGERDPVSGQRLPDPPTVPEPFRCRGCKVPFVGMTSPNGLCDRCEDRKWRW